MGNQKLSAVLRELHASIDKVFKLRELYTCHSREGGNPAKRQIPRSGRSQCFVPLRGSFLTIWIPAFAGMTQWLVAGLFGLNQADRE